MKNKKTLKDFENQWVLIDKKDNVIFSSDNAADVVRKGKEYPFGEVFIEKKIEHGMCFF